MNAFVLRLELRRSRVLSFWLGLTAILYAVFIAAYYPTLAADTELVETMIKNFPKAMSAAFGLEGNLAEQGTYFNVYLLSMLWPLLAAIAAILIPTRTLGADLDRGVLELSHATPISRTSYLMTAIAAQLVVLGALVVVMVAAIVGTLLVVGVPVDLARWSVVAVLALTFACAIASLTTLLSVVTLSRPLAGGLVAGLLVAMYLGQTIAKLAPDVSWVSYLSAFRYFSPAPVVNAGSLPLEGFAIFGVLATVCWAAALWLFRRRDLLR